MQMIEAAMCRQFGESLDGEFINLRAPEHAEIEVTLKAVAICHSDFPYAEGAWGGSLPAAYGHRAAGKVSASGDGVNGIALGDKVIVTLVGAYGSCSCCAQGNPTLCETTYNVDFFRPLAAKGSKLHQAISTSKFAEKVVFDASRVVKFNADIPMDVANLIASGVITSVREIVNTAQLRDGQDVLIIGAGGAGTAHSGAMSSCEPVEPAAIAQSMIESKMGDVVIQQDIP